MTPDTLIELTHWHWWILAIVLVVLEVFAPGAVFLWLGISAAVVGSLLYFVPGIDWEYQLLIFSVLSILSILLWKKYQSKNPVQTDQPQLNRRGSQYIGRLFTLDEPIVNEVGKIHVDDTIWKIQGEDCPANTRVRVTGVDGTILLVEVIS